MKSNVMEKLYKQLYFFCFLFGISLFVQDVKTEENCKCKMCPSSIDARAHCECCVWHYLGKRQSMNSNEELDNYFLQLATDKNTQVKLTKRHFVMTRMRTRAEY
ncbi:Hypothetical predicted protein [Octopus vulgaris]|uniref:Uncharacterized protein n=2 Tax=Octopus TaxID=6643 RepID=A0AA36B5R6_OCTVU|nr:uncharacterized protein LOC118764974 [Octopus sinensis]CAI9727903.1 Hypothetical predicted protein [Octopus vulgaris]